ncbi:MAG: FAD binding domain-containing protein [Bradymonadaceae bacterium]|nr:FAD binding domain-containing protein [Lujinxingiaceae bacterium]
MTTTTQFWLNDRLITTSASAGMLVLDYLRKQERLVGTKEGCKEGDCGACAILIGELVDGRMHYQPVTSCLVPLGEMHGKHVVSIEGLNSRELSPVQDAMVNRCGSQCGFCTPGFVVSMSWYVMCAKGEPSRDGMKRAISGNLCRCTGYASIVRAGDDLVEGFGPGGNWESIWQADDRIKAMAEANMVPAYFNEMPKRLAAIAPHVVEPAHEGAPVDFHVAGGTDLYVQKGEHIPDGQVKILNRHPEMKGIRLEGDTFHVGALTTFEEFGANADIAKMIPRIQDYLFLIASLHLRNRATLSGNIINASPIGDMTILLLALDSELVFFEDDGQRTVAMKDFFKSYKVYDKRPREIMTEIIFPKVDANTRIHFEKVSKRKCLDIATVNSAIKIRTSDEGVIEAVNLTLGGVAAVPLWLPETAKYLVGKSIEPATLHAALDIAQGEISPISDVRGSADYKRLLARQFIIAHFVELFPDRMRFEQVV